jgi:predicted DNA-binding protein
MNTSDCISLLGLIFTAAACGVAIHTIKKMEDMQKFGSNYPYIVEAEDKLVTLNGVHLLHVRLHYQARKAIIERKERGSDTDKFLSKAISDYFKELEDRHDLTESVELFSLAVNRLVRLKILDSNVHEFSADKASEVFEKCIKNLSTAQTIEAADIILNEYSVNAMAVRSSGLNFLETARQKLAGH